MTGRRIDLRTYQVRLNQPGGESEPIPYDVRYALFAYLLHPQLGLTAAGIVEHGPLARKIRACEDDEIILDEKEYGLVVRAINGIGGPGKPGFTANDEELVHRVLDAEKVEVAPVKPAESPDETPATARGS